MQAPSGEVAVPVEPPKDAIEELFTYHAPDELQKTRLVSVRAAAKDLAYAIRENSPRCADQTAALRLLRESVMSANAAIVIPQPKPAEKP